MTENPGKRFERKFRESLAMLPGWHARFRDNSAGFGSKYGNGAMSATNPGDFIYLDSRDGMGRNRYLIECKATSQPSFPFGKISDEQLAELARFERTGRDFKAYIAINFYMGNGRLKNECILVSIDQFLAYRKGTTRKSIHEDDAARIGWRCGPAKGNIWKLPFGRQL